MFPRYRRHIFPYSIMEWAGFITIMFMAPVIYLIDVLLVLPQIHEPTGLIYPITVLAGFFIFFNVIGNLAASMMVDTSVDAYYHDLNPPLTAVRDGWRFCEDCNKLSPPRSWHCDICRLCILKRDHHCIFIGCCVGHLNLRYFFLYIVYILIGSSFSLAYNLYYKRMLKTGQIDANYPKLHQLLCPALFFAFNEYIFEMLYNYCYFINWLGVVSSITILLYHGRGVMRGGVLQEYKKGRLIYDRGLKRNLEAILGKNMKRVWLSPLVRSELPHDGIDWQTWYGR